VTWTVTTDDLPAGLALHQGGSLTGAPRLAGTYRFTATATDSQRRVASHPLSISVAPSLRLGRQRVPAARVGRVYRAPLQASGGVAPRIWTVQHGRLPRGVRLDPTLGVLVGTPTTPGRHRVTVEARDRVGVKTKTACTIVVLPTSVRR